MMHMLSEVFRAWRGLCGFGVYDDSLVQTLMEHMGGT